MTDKTGSDNKSTNSNRGSKSKRGKQRLDYTNIILGTMLTVIGGLVGVMALVLNHSFDRNYEAMLSKIDGVESVIERFASAMERFESATEDNFKEIRKEIVKINETNHKMLIQINNNSNKIDRNAEGIAELKTQLAATNDKFDARFDEVDARFEKVDARFDEVNERIDQTNKEVVNTNIQIEEIKVDIKLINNEIVRVHERLDDIEGNQVAISERLDRHVRLPSHAPLQSESDVTDTNATVPWQQCYPKSFGVAILLDKRNLVLGCDRFCRYS